MAQVYAFRRARTKPGYRKIQADITLPSLADLNLDSTADTAYDYVAVERYDSAGATLGGGEFGLGCGGGRIVWRVYYSIKELGWQWQKDSNGSYIEYQPGTTLRLLVATYDGYMKAWIKTTADTTLYEFTYNTSVRNDGTGQKARRVSTVLTQDTSKPAKAANNRWRNVLVGTPTDFHSFVTSDLDPNDPPGAAPHNETLPTGNESTWITVNTLNSWYNEDVTINIT